MSADGRLVLHQLQFSHYNEKARWALDFKGIEHQRRPHLPGLHVVAAKRLWGGMTLPCLVLDGRAIGESSAIIAELEERWPDPPLYPEAEEARERALALESYFDREVGPHLRRTVFHHTLPDTQVSRDLFAQGFSGPGAAAYRAAFPALRPAFKKAMQVDEEGARVGWERTLGAMDRIESELQPSGYLVGTEFSVADLTAAALLFPLIRPPEATHCTFPDPWPGEMEDLRSSVEDRDAFQWALGIWREHRGESAAV